MIELSKIEHHQAAFDRRVVSVADVVTDALTAFEAVKVGGDVKVVVRLEPDLAVRGDRAALSQAVGNLLSNAWKYTPERGKRIDVVTASEGRRIFISVSDNGEGVEHQEQDLIFEKFHRGAAAQSRTSTGSGLGLAITRAVIEAHRGKIDVRSDAGQGAHFRITLPRCLETA